MRKLFKLSIVVLVLVAFVSSAFAFDMNSYIEKYAVRKAFTPNTKWKARMYTDKKTGTEYKIPAGSMRSDDYCKSGSCTYTWRTDVPQYVENNFVGYKTITGTGEKVVKQGVGTITAIRSDDGKYFYLRVHKSDGFKEAILNNDYNALAKLNEVTGKYGIYYKAEIYKGYVMDPRTKEKKLVDKIRLKKVKTLEEANIDDLRNSDSGSSGSGSGSGEIPPA